MRTWYKIMSPKHVNNILKVYKGEWLPQMDRCWESDDGYIVMSRLLVSKWGKVEHVTISRVENSLAGDGSGDVGWAIKQEIKNELFGERRVAIEVFPETNKLVDVCDVYHLWVLEKGFEIPFGIHPKEFNKTSYINRGCSFTEADYKEYMKFKESQKEEQK